MPVLCWCLVLVFQVDPLKRQAPIHNLLATDPREVYTAMGLNPPPYNNRGPQKYEKNTFTGQFLTGTGPSQ